MNKPIPLTIFCWLLFWTGAVCQTTFTVKSESEDDVLLSNMIVTDNNNTVIATTNPGTGYSKNIILSSFSENGNVLWSNKYSLNNKSYITSAGIVACQNKDLIILTPVINEPDLRGDLLFRLDNRGNVKWSKRIDADVKSYSVSPIGIAESADESIYLVNDIVYYGIQIQKLTKDGSLLWSRYLFTDSSTDNITRPGDCTTTSDGGIVVSTTSFTKYENRFFNHLFKFSGNGSPEWEYTARRPFYYYDALRHLNGRSDGKLGCIYYYLTRFDYVTLDPATGKAEASEAGQSVFDIQAYLRENNITHFTPFSFRASDYFIYAYGPQGSAFQASLYTPTRNKYKTSLQKFDSLGRNCPDFMQPEVKKGRGSAPFIFSKSSFLVTSSPVNLVITDTILSVEPFNLFEKYCSGEAPLLLADKPALPNIQIRTNPEIKITPNPASDFLHLTINLPAACFADITIADGRGGIVKSTKVRMIKGMNQPSVSVADLSSGIYLVRVITPGGDVTQKIIKQ